MHETPCETSVETRTEIKDMKPRIKTLEDRVRGVEIRLAVISALSAAGGGLLGSVLGKSQTIVSDLIGLIKHFV